jgi:hypothetical protein
MTADPVLDRVLAGIWPFWVDVIAAPRRKGIRLPPPDAGPAARPLLGRVSVVM